MFCVGTTTYLHKVHIYVLSFLIICTNYLVFNQFSLQCITTPNDANTLSSSKYAVVQTMQTETDSGRHIHTNLISSATSGMKQMP